jgi:hypothetical protein
MNDTEIRLLGISGSMAEVLSYSESKTWRKCFSNFCFCFGKYVCTYEFGKGLTRFCQSRLAYFKRTTCRSLTSPLARLKLFLSVTSGKSKPYFTTFIILSIFLFSSLFLILWRLSYSFFPFPIPNSSFK